MDEAMSVEWGRDLPTPAQLVTRLAVLTQTVERNERSIKELSEEIDKAINAMRKTLIGVLVSSLVVAISVIATLLTALVGAV